MLSFENVSLVFLAFSIIIFALQPLLPPAIPHPRPQLAASTYLYQTYYSLVGGSRFYIQISKLHTQYGPVIRITPDEVHLSDTSHYESIYHVGTKYSKGPFYDCFGLGASAFTTKDNEIHRIRRGALNPFFSRKKVLETEDIVQSKVEKLIRIAREKFKAGKAIDLHHGFRAVSVDVMTEYCYGECFDTLDHEDLGDKFNAIFRRLGPSLWIGQQWPTLHKFGLSLPAPIASAMSSAVGEVIRLQEFSREKCLAVKEPMNNHNASDAQPSVFHALLSPEGKDELYVVPTVDEIKDEATAFFGAAADTTGSAMTVGTFHVVSNPKIYACLKKELQDAFPDPDTRLDYLKLEPLPYLSAVIKEALRLSYGVAGRLQRVVPEGGATFSNFFIPAGSYIGMSSWMCHQDTNYFPNPLEFDPERWLRDSAEARRMEHAFIPFGKGSRSCVGIQLAYCEVYVMLGTLFRRFPSLKANDLKPEHMVIDDYFGGHYPVDAPKLHVSSPVV